MKLGIALLVIGIALLIVAIPFSILNIVSGIVQLTEDEISSGGLLAYAGIAGVVAGLVMTAIGVTRVFKH